MRATTKDLRLHTAEILAATDRGEQVIITYHGKGLALLTGLPEADRHAKTSTCNPAFGLWADRDEDVESQVRNLRQPRKLP
jgi:prevent-host-death family protein